MLNAAVIGWLIGKAIVGLVRGAAWIIRSAAYLIGAAGGWVVDDPAPARAHRSDKIYCPASPQVRFEAED